MGGRRGEINSAKKKTTGKEKKCNTEMPGIKEIHVTK
jgi:hypothetical protein